MVILGNLIINNQLPWCMFLNFYFQHIDIFQYSDKHSLCYIHWLYTLSQWIFLWLKNTIHKSSEKFRILSQILWPSPTFWKNFPNFALFPVINCRHVHQKTKIRAKWQNLGHFRAILSKWPEFWPHWGCCIICMQRRNWALILEAFLLLSWLIFIVSFL